MGCRCCRSCSTTQLGCRGTRPPGASSPTGRPPPPARLRTAPPAAAAAGQAAPPLRYKATIHQCGGSGIFIPDTIFFHPGSELSASRIRIEEFKHDPGCLSRIRMLTFYPSRIQGSKRHRIPDPDPQHCHSH